MKASTQLWNITAFWVLIQQTLLFPNRFRTSLKIWKATYYDSVFYPQLSTYCCPSLSSRQLRSCFLKSMRYVQLHSRVTRKLALLLSLLDCQQGSTVRLNRRLIRLGWVYEILGDHLQFFSMPKCSHWVREGSFWQFYLWKQNE